MSRFFNGDRVCCKKSHSSTRILEFGRVQEYVDIQDAFGPPSGQFSEYGDVLLSSDDMKLSSCVSPPPLLDSGDGKSLKSVPLLHLLSSSTSSKPKKSPFGSDGSGDDDGKCIPGLVSPIMMKRSKSQPDMMEQMKQSDDTEENREIMKNVKRRIIWDNGNKKETEILGERDANLYKVVDRKFSVGQVVTAAITSSRYGKRGKVVEVKPLATVHVPFSDPENKQETAHVIRDLNLAEIKPISSLFCGVTVEFNGWIGQINNVERQVVYKLEDSTYLTRKFQDLSLLRKSHTAPGSSETIKEQRTIQNQFSYPFMKHTEMPFTGKVERFSPLQLQQLKIEEEEDKENNQNNRYSTRSKTGSTSSSSSSPTLTLLNVESRKKSKADRENFITAIVESVSIVSVKVRWTGRLPAYLIKPKSEATTTALKEKASSKWKGTVQQAAQNNEGMPFTTIRSAEDVKRVRPLYINPAMYFEKKGLCAYTTDKRNEEIMIPERLWAYELYKEAGDNNGGSAEVVAPFNLSTISLSSPPVSSTTTSSSIATVEEKKGKDSCMKNTADDYNNQGKRKRCHHDEDTTKDEESGGGSCGGGAVGKRTVIVCKHFVRHFYKVAWEDNKKLASKRRSSSGGDSKSIGLEWWCGTKLYPVASQEHKLCLGLIHSHLYVVPRASSFMYGKCDYGVVVDKPTNNSIVVDWMKIQKDGSVSTVRILKCDLLDIEKHQKFNELHEGRIVVRCKDADGFKSSREFSFGTIVRVNRFALGQISVYSATQEKMIELWPHMVELFVGMSMQELIAHKVVGANRKLNEQSITT